jgi:hypothetical protein
MTDAKDLVKRCKGCQFFAKQQHLPAETLRMIPPSGPFSMWGLVSIDRLEPLLVTINISSSLWTNSPSRLKSDLLLRSRQKKRQSSSRR